MLVCAGYITTIPKAGSERHEDAVDITKKLIRKGADTVAIAAEVIENMAEQYYRPRGLPVKAEIVMPVGGLCTLDV